MTAARAWLRRLWPLLGAAVLLGYLDHVGWGAIAGRLAALGAAGVAAVLLGGLGEALCDALALRAAALGRITLRRALELNQAGALLNSLAPGEAGEVLKGTLLAQDVPGDAAAATVVWNLAFRLATPLVLVAGALLGWAALPGLRPRALALLALAAASFLLYLGLRELLRRGGTSALAGFVARHPRLRGARAERLVRAIARVERAATAFWREHPGRYGHVVAWSAAARVVSLVNVAVVLWALGAPVAFAHAALIYVGTQLANYLLMWTPTRLGTTEVAAGVVFHFLGLHDHLGVVYQVVCRLRAIALYTLGLRAARARPGAAAAREVVA